MQIRLGVGLLWAMCGGFAAGIFLRSITVVPEPFIIGLGLIALLIVGINARESKKLRIALVVAAALVSCGVGILRMQSVILVGDPYLNSHIGQKLQLEGVVSDEPDARATQVRVPVRVLSAADSSRSTNSGQANSGQANALQASPTVSARSTTSTSSTGLPQASSGQASSVQATVLAIFPAHTELYYGERIYFTGTLTLPQAFDAGAGRQFNYPGYLAAQGISYELDRATLKSGEGFEGNAFIAGAYKVKELFVTGLERALPEPQAGLAGGITVGDKRAMGKDLSQEFRTVSLVHIVVLSGYNITVVIKNLFSVLEWLGTSRYIRFGAGGSVAIFFAVMTGFASASLRAALMALIAISGTLSGRIYRADRALALVSAGMLAWNPYLLVFDPGFQLSFLACAGLLVFSPIFSRCFARVPKTLGLREIVISTSSAQIAVLPLLLYESGNLSLVSLPANLLVLAAVPPAMLFSALAALGGLLIEPLAPIIGFPAQALLTYILNVTHILAHVPFASIAIPAFSAWLLAPVYAALFGYGLYAMQKEKAAQE